MSSKCIYVGCKDFATVILIHPITKLFMEACDRHKGLVKQMLIQGRKKKYTIFEQQSLDPNF